jgi:hypothetical protein
MPEQNPGRLRLERCGADGQGFVSSRLVRQAVRRAAAGLTCAAFFCAAAAAPSGAVAAAAGDLLFAQAEDQNQPAEAAPAAPPAAKPETKPAPKHPPKPAPKPQVAAPAKTTPQPPPAPAAAAPAAPAVTPAAAPAQPAPPQPPPSTAAEPQPLVHASQAGVKSCLDGIARAANGTIDTQHAMSQWFTGAADSQLFQSIISLAYPNKVAPHAAAVLLAAPTQGQSCDTSTVQIFPTARPCNAVLADLLKTGKVIASPGCRSAKLQTARASSSCRPPAMAA